MNVTRKSQITGETHTVDLDVTDDQLARYSAGELIQEVFPHLTPSEREFLMTGVTPEEWDYYVRPDDTEEP